VRVIEEDDAWFDLVIPTRNPYADSLIFGWVRTEFPYSENIYHMDEYNGSTRESRSPCDVDKDFLDTCNGGQSSKYTIDLRIEQLSNDRIREALEILQEYTPFHAVLHQMNFEGLVNEFLEPPVEEVIALIQYSLEDITISGNAQMFFNRVTENGLHSIRRDSLATATLVTGAPWVAATGYNSSIVLYAPDVKLDTVGWDVAHPTKNILEILTGVHAGIYTCSNPSGHMAVVNGVPPVAEPISQSSFNFRLSLDLYQNVNTAITQEFNFSDAAVNFADLWDENNPRIAYDGSWVIELPAYTWPDPPPGGPGNDEYQIIAITTDGKLLLNDYAHSFNTLPTINATGITYTVRNSTGYLIQSATTGRWTKTTRGIIDFSSDLTIDNVRNLFEIGYYVLYMGGLYEIVGFVPVDGALRFYIGNYTAGDAAGVTVDVQKRLADNQIGYLQYQGMNFQTVLNYETTLGILNGVNAPVDPNLILDSDLWKESFLAVVHKNPPSDDDYYAIAQINGTTINLNGPQQTWTTLAAGGTPVNIHIYQYEKEHLTIPERSYPPMPEHTFEFVDRRGNDVVDIGTQSVSPFLPFMALAEPSGISELISQNESVTFSIEYKE
jgi:hypothetical protein